MAKSKYKQPNKLTFDLSTNTFEDIIVGLLRAFEKHETHTDGKEKLKVDRCVDTPDDPDAINSLEARMGHYTAMDRFEAYSTIRKLSKTPEIGDRICSELRSMYPNKIWQETFPLAATINYVLTNYASELTTKPASK